MSEYVVCPHCHNPLPQNEWVKVVRCRDCKYASYDNRWCYRLLNAEEPPITPDGFCAWGEKK